MQRNARMGVNVCKRTHANVQRVIMVYAVNIVSNS